MEVIKTYYDSGKLKSEVVMINNKKEGEYKEYYENGQLNVKSIYIDDWFHKICEKRQNMNKNLVKLHQLIHLLFIIKIELEYYLWIYPIK